MVSVEFWQVRECPALGCSDASMNRSKWCKAYSEELGRSGCLTFAIAGSPLSDAQRLDPRVTRSNCCLSYVLGA